MKNAAVAPAAQAITSSETVRSSCRWARACARRTKRTVTRNVNSTASAEENADSQFTIRWTLPNGSIENRRPMST